LSLEATMGRVRTRRPQDPVPAGEVCDNDLDHWFLDAILYPRPWPIPSTPKPPLTMACRQVLLAP
jgi:penicillin-insensitive murein DD-endopeptidase